MQDEITIEEMTESVWTDVREIYDAGISTGNATFEIRSPDWMAWDNAHLKTCRLIASNYGKILGWAALSPVSQRTVYAGVAEVSIYIAPRHQGLGIGDLLMKALITKSEMHGIWTLQAAIFPENEGSLRLHLKNGFRIVGTRERIGKMNGRWRDVLFMERRSENAGND